MYSALKHKGRPLYTYARKGETAERRPRKVTIHALELLSFLPPDRACLRVRCSKGTYVRTLAADIGQSLGVGAYLYELRRTASGPFTLEQAIGPDEVALRVADGRPLPVLSPLAALAHLPRVMVDEKQALVLQRGQRMAWAALGKAMEIEGPVCAAIEGTGGPVLVAVVARDGEGVRILRGFRGE
jgi:tRNA pseudouridine55 synthase